MKIRLIAGLDIGTHTVKMVVAKVRDEGGGLELLAFAEERSSGVRKGSVVSPEDITKKIIQVKDRVEQASSHKVGEVFLTIGGSNIFVTPSHGIVAVSRADGQIAQEDVDRVLQASQVFSLPLNKEILSIFPKQFIVDGEVGTKEVVGMKGVRLETDVLAVCAFSPYLKNLTNAVLAAGLEIADIVPTPLASAATVLTSEEKELGAAVVDIGAGTTGISVFDEGDLVHLAIFPIGSANITNDIAIGLRTEHDVAERIKIEFGTCLGAKGKKIEKFELPNGDSLSFSPKFLNHIIEERVGEILELVNKELKKIGKQGKLPAGVVFVGGGAKLAKIVEFAKKELKLPARIGSSHGIVSVEKDPAFLAAIGLVSGKEDLLEAGEQKRIRAGNIFSLFKKAFKAFIP